MDIATKLFDSIPLSCMYYVTHMRKLVSSQLNNRHVEKDGKRCILKNPELKVPYNINSILSLGKKGFNQNYHRLYNLFLFSRLHANQENIETMRPDLSCDHEESDTMLAVMGDFMVRSPSRNIDIIMLFGYHVMNCDACILITVRIHKERFWISTVADFQSNKEAQ